MMQHHFIAVMQFLYDILWELLEGHDKHELLCFLVWNIWEILCVNGLVLLLRVYYKEQILKCNKKISKDDFKYKRQMIMNSV